MKKDLERNLAKEVIDVLNSKEMNEKFHFMRVDRIFHNYYDLIIDKKIKGEEFNKNTYKKLRNDYLKYKREIKNNKNN
ncbi:MAG TPA: hypothetical protein VJ912_03215 [Candidatus Nanoarchaeia archaeon]|nr:hypothetical protein [Candidatus Nanoarchaeia archaeon]